MSNLYLQPTIEKEPVIACHIEAIEALSVLAVESAGIEVKSRYLQALRDMGEPVNPESITELNEEWFQLNGEVRKIAGEDTDLLNTFNSAYTTHFLDAFRVVRDEYALNSNQ